LAPVFALLVQIVNAGAQPFAGSGSQSLITEFAKGEAKYLGRCPAAGCCKGRRLLMALCAPVA
jgi:hypothetical protein